MNIFLILAFLFCIGAMLGWVIELFYRHFDKAYNPERKWINPGFCTGPYLPVYGCGLCVLYLVAALERFSLVRNPIGNKLLLFLAMAVCMTAIEYVAGILVLKVAKVRLWDYSKEWGNLQGIICPRFSFYWAILGGIYYFFIHPYILDALNWLSLNLAFSFVIGFFYGIFVMDVCHSFRLISKLKKYAEENDVIICYESLKTEIRKRYDETKQKYHFFRPFYSDKSLADHLLELKENLERRKKKNNRKTKAGSDEESQLRN